MTAPYFPTIERIPYAGPESRDPLAYRWYDADGISREVGGRTVEAAIEAARETWTARDGWDFRVDA